MSIEFFLNKLNNDKVKPSMENYVMFSLDEIPEVIKKLESGEKIIICRSSSDNNIYLENQIYVSDTGFFLIVTDIQAVDREDQLLSSDDNFNELMSYNDTNLITLDRYDKIAPDDTYKFTTIKSELDNAKNIWVTSDYHLMLYDDNGIYDNKYTEKIINNQNKYVSDDDIFIYLGDLVDGEVSDREIIKDTIKKLKGKKILIRGNNDVLPDDFYEECGFIAVLNSFKYKNIIFSHPPLHKSQFNGAEYNIHGHIHGCRKYFVPYNNHIDAYFKLHNKNPMCIDKLIEKCKDGFYKPE